MPRSPETSWPALALRGGALGLIAALALLASGSAPIEAVSGAALLGALVVVAGLIEARAARSSSVWAHLAGALASGALVAAGAMGAYLQAAFARGALLAGQADGHGEVQVALGRIDVVGAWYAGLLLCGATGAALLAIRERLLGALCVVAPGALLASRLMWRDDDGDFPPGTIEAASMIASLVAAGALGVLEGATRHLGARVGGAPIDRAEPSLLEE